MATFHNLGVGGEAPTYPTVAIPGNITVEINGQQRSFENGALVFSRNGQIEAMPFESALGGRITVGSFALMESSAGYGGPVSGNMATLRYGWHDQSLTLTMPEHTGPGFSMHYSPDAQPPAGTSPHASEGTPDTGAPPHPRVDAPPPQPPPAHPIDGTPPPQTEVAPSDAPVAGTVGRLARVLAPIALAAAPVIEGGTGAYNAIKHGESGAGIALHTAEGVGKGVVDTYLPGAINGYSDVFGHGQRTFFDRALNAAGDLTGTTTAVGSTAILAETAGILTIPAVIPTAAVTLVAGISNLGINSAKGLLKVTGLAGRDQDGGYIYDGAVAAIHGVEHLFGSHSTATTETHRSAQVDEHSEALVRHSAAAAINADGKSHSTVESVMSWGADAIHHFL